MKMIEGRFVFVLLLVLSRFFFCILSLYLIMFYLSIVLSCFGLMGIDIHVLLELVILLFPSFAFTIHSTSTPVFTSRLRFFEKLIRTLSRLKLYKWSMTSWWLSLTVPSKKGILLSLFHYAIFFVKGYIFQIHSLERAKEGRVFDVIEENLIVYSTMLRWFAPIAEDNERVSGKASQYCS